MDTDSSQSDDEIAPRQFKMNNLIDSDSDEGEKDATQEIKNTSKVTEQLTDEEHEEPDNLLEVEKSVKPKKKSPIVS